MTRFHLHLVSDSTGETVHSMARACLVQFDDAQAVEHVWSMVRTRSQIDRVIAGVEANPGVVLFTMVNDTLRQLLQEGCRRLQVPAIPVLDPIIGALASYLHRKSRGTPKWVFFNTLLEEHSAGYSISSGHAAAAGHAGCCQARGTFRST